MLGFPYFCLQRIVVVNLSEKLDNLADTCYITTAKCLPVCNQEKGWMSVNSKPGEIAG